MQIRASRISASISAAINENRHEHHHSHHSPANETTPLTSTSHNNNKDNKDNKKKSSSSFPLGLLIASFFRFFHLHLTRYQPSSFFSLRKDSWKLDEDEYLDSFPEPVTRKHHHHHQQHSRDADQVFQDDNLLVPVGDLGYSGSTFFTTPNAKFLVKSLPRRFEYRFFTDELLAPYVAHNQEHPDSLLVRITDMPYAPRPSLGSILGTAPTHHIVMENLLFGKPEGDEGKKWETYDLKPDDYFFPERDIANGNLAPQSVKDRLIDEFPDKKIIVPLDNREQLLATLNHDTQLLAAHSAVDYSLFLVRYPQTNADTAALPSGVSCPWREGVPDVRGEWTYRAVVLDFFWAKSALQAKAMTGLVDTYNVVADQGPMSITAEPGEYRQRFMKMVDNLVTAEAGEAVRDGAEE
jgi:hypothetical protein